MNKESILFGVIGLLAGLIIGFMFANSINQSAMVASGAQPAAGGAMKQNSNMPPGHPDIGGTNEQAEAEAQAAADEAKKAPDDFEAQMKAAGLYYEIGRYNGAIEFLTQANKLKPDDYQTIVNLGNAYFDANRYEEAEKWYLQALSKKADDVNVRTDLGLTFIFRAQPNYDRAVQEFKRSLEVNPNHPQTLQNLTVAYTKKGDLENAKQTLARFEALDAKNQAIPKLREEIQKDETK